MKHKKSCRVLNYIDHLLIVISTTTGCVFISAFTSFAPGIKKYMSAIKKKKKKHDKIVLLTKSKLNSIEV